MNRLTVLAVLLAGVSSLHADSVRTSQVTVEGAWVREPAGRITGGYLTLKNPTIKPVTLKEASTPAAKFTEIHRMVMRGDAMQMEKIDSLVIPPGQTVVLRPGGLHLMLIELVRPLKAGERIPLELTFTDGVRNVQALVRATGGARKEH